MRSTKSRPMPPSEFDPQLNGGAVSDFDAQSRPESEVEQSFAAIGTTWTLTTQEPISSATFTRIRVEADLFDSLYSRFRTDSVVAELARNGGSRSFPETDAALFDLYDELYSLTDGAVSPLVGGALSHLGYDADYSLVRRPGSFPVPLWPETVQRSGQTGTTVTLSEPAVLDFGAAGKGFLVDRISRLLVDAGHYEVTVDASGDLVHSGGAPLRVALEHPFDPSKAIGVVELDNRALCASGSNRRVWGSGLHHILDARTAEPTADVIATWVIASSALLADGLATALFFAQPSALATRFSFEWVRMFSSGVAERSRTLPGELFS
jgi:thiamine biosynthesis lipoprotein